MEFKNHGNGILELADDSLINTAEGLLNIFAEYECEALIVKISHLCPAFFRLSTGVAGDMLQKISTYRLKFAVYGDFSEAPKP
ncbi:MAG: DUF4180 domain-containing protein, partial [Bacteroidales bacterium]|nr:DUF4180 domain-containing protein [Bacteroidales bacterium]